MLYGLPKALSGRHPSWDRQVQACSSQILPLPSPANAAPRALWALCTGAALGHTHLLGLPYRGAREQGWKCGLWQGLCLLTSKKGHSHPLDMRVWAAFFLGDGIQKWLSKAKFLRVCLHIKKGSFLKKKNKCRILSLMSSQARHQNEKKCVEITPWFVKLSYRQRWKNKLRLTREVSKGGRQEIKPYCSQHLFREKN